MANFQNVLTNTVASQASTKLYLNGELADVHFIFEDDDKGDTQRIPPNKAILAALSPVFKAMFFGTMKESGDVKIGDATIDAFKEFLQFFYLPKITLTMEHMKEVAQSADKYDILDYVRASVENLKKEIDLDNWCWVYQLAIFTEQRAITKNCSNYIVLFSKDIFDTDAFCHCDQVILKHILQLNYMSCSEFEVLDACLKWAKFACKRSGIDENRPENWRFQLGDCLKLIRFGSMDVEEFAEHTVKYRKGFLTSDELADIFFAKVSGSNIYKNTPRTPPYHLVKEDFDNLKDEEILTCLLPIRDNNRVSHLAKTEEVFFSADFPVLLRKISLQPIHSSGGGDPDLVLMMQVFEWSDRSFEESVEKTRIFNQTVTISLSVIESIYCELRISPRKMYRITWDVLNDKGFDHYYYGHNDPSRNKIKVDDKLSITLSTPPGENAISTGLLARLGFNHIYADIFKNLRF